MILKELKPNDIERMHYNELIGIIQETNRPPGGLRSLIDVAIHSFLTSDKKVLEIGTSTGFTALELSQLTDAHITAIDINEHCLSIAKKRAAVLGLRDRISFQNQNAESLEFPNESFDLVFCGNVNSIIEKKEKALSEYIRLLKWGGILSAIPMYYITKPPKSIVDKVSNAIDSKIKPMYKKDWVEFYSVKPLRPFWSKDFKFDEISRANVNTYAKKLMKGPHLQNLNVDTFMTLKKNYLNYMMAFRENLLFMGYSILLMRKECEVFEPELFTGHML